MFIPTSTNYTSKATYLNGRKFVTSITKEKGYAYESDFHTSDIDHFYTGTETLIYITPHTDSAQIKVLTQKYIDG